jgi:hypothetical protein
VKDLKQQKMRKEIFKTAWQFFRQTGKSFSECLKQAWKNYKLKIDLLKGIVRFYFQKTDGTIREAWGTLKDVEDKIKGVEKEKNLTIQVYYDTEKQEFRSFKKFNLV